MTDDNRRAAHIRSRAACRGNPVLRAMPVRHGPGLAFRGVVAALIALVLAFGFAPGALVTSGNAELSVPGWYDQNAVGAGPDWHYRIAVTTPATSAVNSTVVVNVDFAALFAALGVAGTFDANSPRVVRPNGTLATTQEFTDSVHAGVTDAVGNARGEIRFLAQEAGIQTYFIYFDIVENGAKPVNPQTPINGNFERGATGTAAPAGWTAPTKTNAGFDAQVRPDETVSVTTNGGGASPATVLTDGTPHTGQFSYLIGARSVNEPANGNPAVTFQRTIVVPASNPGDLTVRYRVEGWDSSANGATQWDFLRIAIISGGTTEIVGPTAGNYTSFPFAPNFGTQTATATRSGYGQYNGWDTDTNGNHRSGMTINRGSEPWFTRTVSLAAFAGQTVTLRFTSAHQTQFRTWHHIDDVEWSVVSGTLGTPEAFGVKVLLPTAATALQAGGVLSIRAQVDAAPTAAANPVTVDVFDENGIRVASAIRLYNDGSHGDTAANDAIWTNDGSVPADPTYTITGAGPQGNGWIVRAFAKDASASTIGAQAGLVRRIGQPGAETEANFHNIDDQTFIVNVPRLTIVKAATLVSDPVKGAVNPFNIPGAIVQYQILVANTGGAATDGGGVAVADVLSPATELFVGDLSGSGSGPVQFVNGAPPSGLTYSFAGLGSAVDSLDFSSDGGTTWTYVPGGTYDPLVTAIRVRPAGALAPNSGAGDPSFTLLFRVRVK